MQEQENIENNITHQDAVKKANNYIARLLKKRIWTGEETGKVYLYDFIRVTETRNETLDKQRKQIVEKTRHTLTNPNFDKKHTGFTYNYLIGC
jgi:hypothetical protein